MIEEDVTDVTILNYIKRLGLTFKKTPRMPIELSQDTEVSVTIYDVQGKRIRQLQLGLVTAGRYVTADRAVYWDGKTETGEQVASGVYFYTIQAGELTDTRKMLLMK
jgi:flagellar hook assembly protein FlgD